MSWDWMIAFIMAFFAVFMGIMVLYDYLARRSERKKKGEKT